MFNAFPFHVRMFVFLVCDYPAGLILAGNGSRYFDNKLSCCFFDGALRRSEPCCNAGYGKGVLQLIVRLRCVKTSIARHVSDKAYRVYCERLHAIIGATKNSRDGA